MNREFIDIKDFTILVELAEAKEALVDTCYFDEPVIAVAFYGSGNVHLEVEYAGEQQSFDHTQGLALSFYADAEVQFKHHVSADRPLECLVIATSLRHIESLPEQEVALFQELLDPLLHPKGHFVAGPQFYMSAAMQQTVDQAFRNQLEGKAKMMFFRSQMTALLAHYFGELSRSADQSLPHDTLQRLDKAREILLANLEEPPGLSDLAAEIGMNTNKLKQSFKAHVGLPVFRYLQNQRLEKAHELIRSGGATVQEAAWQVGYDSLSSFSKAFAQKFGYRPSEIRA